ncbi:MAG: hypothetical protein SGJ19_18915 [Planctomycetia bacterium]|nr:hypothetical protein [Planctomycetia bacterium]
MADNPLAKQILTFLDALNALGNAASVIPQLQEEKRSLVRHLGSYSVNQLAAVRKSYQSVMAMLPSYAVHMDDRSKPVLERWTTRAIGAMQNAYACVKWADEGSFDVAVPNAIDNPSTNDDFGLAEGLVKTLLGIVEKNFDDDRAKPLWRLVEELRAVEFANPTTTTKADFSDGVTTKASDAIIGCAEGGSRRLARLGKLKHRGGGTAESPYIISSAGAVNYKKCRKKSDGTDRPTHLREWKCTRCANRFKFPGSRKPKCPECKSIYVEVDIN